MEHPLISVVIPTWNAADYLPQTLDSVLAQTWDRVEILVVDDGSTDDTADVVARYGDRVRCLRQENWGGPSRPRNLAVEAARGELIAFFDADDLMEPDKLSVAAEAFGTSPEIDFVFSSFREIDEKGRVLKEDFLAGYTEFRRHLEPGDPPRLPGRTAYGLLLRANYVGTSSVVCRRELLDRVGSFDEEMLNADDIDMWRRMAWSGATFAFLDRVLHSYRKVPGGVTGRGAAHRLPAVLRGLRKQLDLDLTESERAGVTKRLHDFELQFAYGLCEAGRIDESRKLYLRLLRERFSWPGLKGWLRTWLQGARG